VLAHGDILRQRGRALAHQYFPRDGPNGFPDGMAFRVDGNVLAFTMLAALGVGLFSGAWRPVLHTKPGRTEQDSQKKTGTGTATPAKRKSPQRP